MAEHDISPPVQLCSPLQVPAPPKPAHTAMAFHKTQRRYAQRPINHFPWKDFHLGMTSQGYVVGSDWAMATFDNRTEDQFFDSKRLQTIDEGTEVRYFLPYDQLNFSTDLENLNVMNELRRLDSHRKESMIQGLFYRVKDCLALLGHRIFCYCHHLFTHA